METLGASHSVSTRRYGKPGLLRFKVILALNKLLHRGVKTTGIQRSQEHYNPNGHPEPYG